MNIKVGQVYADKDKRRQGRQLRVERINGDWAECSTRSNDQAEFGQKLTRINLNRFSRYQLIEDQATVQRDQKAAGTPSGGSVAGGRAAAAAQSMDASSEASPNTRNERIGQSDTNQGGLS